jgi:hypothetical protein
MKGVVRKSGISGVGPSRWPFPGSTATAPAIAYNDGVNKPATPSVPATSAAQRGRGHVGRQRILRAETIGVIVIALAILIFTVLRYGGHINWGAR